MVKAVLPGYLVRTRPRVYSDTVGETLTQIEFASECDINFQIERFKGLGINPHRPLDPEQMQDITDLAADFVQAHQILEDGRAAFEELPERVQQRFSGSPAQFMEFMNDIHNNADEAVKLGLLKLRATESPTEPSPVAGKAPGAPAAPAAQGSGA